MNAPEHVLRHLKHLGFTNTGDIYYAEQPASLYEEALFREEGNLGHTGPLIVHTDPYTGRSPHDRFIVREPSSEKYVHWGNTNRPIDPEVFEHLLHRLTAFAQKLDLFVQDVYAGADPAYRLPVRFITGKAWHNLFVHNMFIRPSLEELQQKPFTPEYTVIDLSDFKAIPAIDGVNSEAFILLHLGRGLILIGGTAYGGEMKKSIFSVMNYLLPFRGVFPMHCSANIGKRGDTALFFGLSGTGKTTLSADPNRTLIGDDEHGWSDKGIFNFEGGCYAKVIRLSPEKEPEIYQAVNRFGAILENVVFDPLTHKPNFDSDEITENSRGSYPLHFIPNASESGTGGHPENILFLTADAFGVLPPIARLNKAQAMYHFLSGYTAKVAGTERGITEPQATFSACFGEPFMILPPTQYAEMLGERIDQHQPDTWLINTGWTGGPYGVGYRIPLEYTRAMVQAILDGKLKDAETYTDPVFGFAVPKAVPGVPEHLLYPRSTWSDPEAYDQQALKLARMFAENFKKFEPQLPEEVRKAGPKLEL